MADLIDKLHDKIKELGARSFFNPPASPAEIEKVESLVKIKLPESLRRFYLRYNGGFFADGTWISDDKPLKDDLASIRWNSNYILSVQDIIASYNFDEHCLASCDIQEQEIKYERKLLPFLHTSGQEMLVLDFTSKERTPILDAFHEVNCNEWGVLYHSFDDFLLDYIEKEGDIETIASVEET